MIRAYFIGLLNGVILAGIAIGLLFAIPAKPHKKEAAKVETKAISGASATVTGTESKSDGVHQIAEYSGEGKSEIVTPYEMIPPADHWINKRSSVMVYYSARGCLLPVYSYRIESFIVSGGARVPVRRLRSFNDYDIFGGVGWCF